MKVCPICKGNGQIIDPSRSKFKRVLDGFVTIASFGKVNNIKLISCNVCLGFKYF